MISRTDYERRFMSAIVYAQRRGDFARFGKIWGLWLDNASAMLRGETPPLRAGEATEAGERYAVMVQGGALGGLTEQGIVLEVTENILPQLLMEEVSRLTKTKEGQ